MPKAEGLSLNVGNCCDDVGVSALSVGESSSIFCFFRALRPVCAYVGGTPLTNSCRACCTPHSGENVSCGDLPHQHLRLRCYMPPYKMLRLLQSTKFHGFGLCWDFQKILRVFPGRVFARTSKQQFFLFEGQSIVHLFFSKNSATSSITISSPCFGEKHVDTDQRES